MGHWHAGNDSQIVQTLPVAIGGLWGGPAFWNNTAYFGGQFDNLKAFAFNPATEQLSTTYTSESPEVFGYPGSTPVVSSNGATTVLCGHRDRWRRRRLRCAARLSRKQSGN
jgi:hypothetical protein